MGRIHPTADDLANQIAAGEVVERPASVVKELVENAIDAGARRAWSSRWSSAARSSFASKTTATGWSRRMPACRSSGMRPARSGAPTISRAIATLGFRGEAIPSIASVSHFRLRTRPRGADSATEIRVNGGAVESVVESRRAGRHARRGGRSVLQPARAPEVPEVRRGRVRRRSRGWSRSSRSAIPRSGSRSSARAGACCSARRWRGCRIGCFRSTESARISSSCGVERGGLVVSGFVAALAERARRAARRTSSSIAAS